MTSNIIKDFIREDGYINATLLCKYGEKEFKHWNSLETTKKLIIYCEKYTNIEKNYKLIRVLRKNLACVNTFLSQKHKEYLNAK